MNAYKYVFLPLCLAAVVSSMSVARGAGSGFTFVTWGDTKGGLEVLANQSKLAAGLHPALTLYCGDLVRHCDVNALNRWKAAVNGDSDNGLFDRTFAVRGNHDKGSQSIWQEFFNFGTVTAAIGATNYRSLADDLTYSFDYGNSHFAAVDVVGDVTLMTPREIAWLDADLTTAERRGLEHAFLFWHGPLYPVGGHCCSAAKPEFVELANRHPILSAVFHGHEHQMAWVHVDKSRYGNVTHPFEEFVTGSSGARTAQCDGGRSDYCRKATGFAAVDVSGNSFTVSFYLNGNPVPAWKRTFVKPARTAR